MAERHDDARVQEIRARIEAATPGPWQAWPDGPEESVESVSVGRRFVCHMNSNMRQFREDAAFIAHAREDVPYLLNRLDALAQERDECQRMLEDLTPGGSEFYRNPIRCRNWVQDRLSSAHTKTVKAVRERDVLRVERDIARRVEQESSAAADAWQAEAVKVRGERDALTAERDELLVASRECRESMSRAMTAMARDVVTINDLKARAERAEAALRYYAEVREYARIGGDPTDALPPIMHDKGRRARAALAAASEGAQEGCDGSE